MNNKIQEKIKYNHIWPNWFINITDLLKWWAVLIKELNNNNKKYNVIIKNLKELEYINKLLKNFTIFLYVDKLDNLLSNKNININFIIDIKYDLTEYNLLEKHLSENKYDNKILYLDIKNIKNQEEVNNSYFLEIFNLFKSNNFTIKKDYLRYESAYKNIYLIGPRELTFDISEYCNANCIFCFTNWPGYLDNRWWEDEINDNKFKQKTNVENLLNIINESEYVGIDLLTLWITWDPFISKEYIVPILKQLPNTKLKVGFLTNWYWLLENVDEIIKCNNIESFYINISAWDLDSFKKTRIWDKFIDFLNTWKAIKIINTNRPDIKIKALYVITPINYKWVVDFVKLCESNNVDEIEFKEVVNYWFEEKMKFNEIDINNIIELFRKIDNITIKNNKEVFIKTLNKKFDSSIKEEEKYNELPTKCYNQYLYNAIVRDVSYTCCKFIVSLWWITNWKLANFYKTIEQNNKIFQVANDIKQTVWEKKYLENCSRCFHLHNLDEINEYINRKNKLLNLD